MLARFVLFLKGFAMGIADVIPGVSGGTMALILGIYERVVHSIRNVDLGLIRALFTGTFWKRGFYLLFHPGAETDDPSDRYPGTAAFLLVLLIGIAAAALTGVRIIPRLMTEYRAPTLGFFFGLVLASVVVPYRMMERRSWREAVAFVLTVVGTFLVVGLPIDDAGNARGEVLVSVRDPGAQTKPVVLDAADTKFSTFFHEGNPKREIIFVPQMDEPTITVPADGSAVRVPLVAQMAGEEGNVEGAVTHLLQPSDLRGELVVTQPAPIAGGASPALWYIFLCGAIAICAMILPGISGSFILLLLGQYFYVVFTVHEIVYGHDMGRLPVLGVFLAGLVVGILAFARLLDWLLRRFHSVVMAVLVGLMLGSLRKIWPFQTLTVDGTENRLPAVFDGTVALTAATFVAGVVIVLTLNWIGARKGGASTAT